MERGGSQVVPERGTYSEGSFSLSLMSFLIGSIDSWARKASFLIRLIGHETLCIMKFSFLLNLASLLLSCTALSLLAVIGVFFQFSKEKK